MKTEELRREDYKNYSLDFEYTTSRYYDVEKKDGLFNIELILKEFGKYVVKHFSGRLYEDFFEEARAFQLIDNEVIVGFLEINYERWNRRLRVTNLLVLNDFRKKGYGTVLLNKAKEIAKEDNMREIVLETQSCNYPAIQMYLKNGFKVNGIDLSSYSNNDMEAKEVRLELIYRL